MRDLARLSIRGVVLSVAGVAVATVAAVTVVSLPRPTDVMRPATITALLVGAAVIVGAALVAVRLITEPLRHVATALCALVDGAPGHGGPAGTAGLGHVPADLDLLALQVRTTRETTSRSASAVADITAQLAADGRRIDDGVADADRHAKLVTAAAEGASRTMVTALSSTEEIGRSAHSIAGNLTEATRVAGQAVELAESTNQIVSKLGDSSAEIGTVVKVITAIAEQTKLLALNASIEAHRAGELGAGFAIVATEVKDLAQQTAAATDEISRRVAAIQADSADAVGAVWQISSVIEQISDLQREIANEVDQQTTITGNVGRDVTAAADASGAVAGAVETLVAALASAGAPAGRTNRFVDQLTAVSQHLRRMTDPATDV